MTTLEEKRTAREAHNPRLLDQNYDGTASISHVTLRDLVAALVMPACVSRHTIPERSASDAYEYAEAFLAERAKK